MNQFSRSTVQSNLLLGWLPPPRTLAFSLLLVLSLQFVLGMLANLFVVVPTQHPGSGSANYFAGLVAGVAWAITQGAWALRLHALLGLVLIVCGVALVAAAFSWHQRVWIVSSIIAVLSTIGAGFNGGSFLNYGHNFSSLLMSLLFAIALVALLVGLYLTSPDK